MANISIRETIQLVQSMYSKGIPSKDSRLSSRQVYSELINARSTIFRQKSNKNQAINQWTIQTIPCIELIKALPYECPCVPAMGKYILRTKYKLPTAITGLNNALISSMTTLDGITRIDPSSYEQVKYDVGKKYTSTSPSYYINNEYGYIVHRTQLKAVTIRGVYDDPIQVYMFPSICGPCAECECKDIQDYDFPIDRNDVTAITRLAYDRLVILFGQMKQDKSNNATDDAGVGGGQIVHQPQEQPIE